MRIPALTVRAPYANAFMELGKDTENRTRNLVGEYLGPLAIHVGLRLAHSSAWADVERRAGGRGLTDGPLCLGHVIGLVDVVGVHRYPSCLDADGAHCSWWAEQAAGVWHIETGNPRPLPRPFRATGALGLWWLTDAQMAAISEQLGVSIDG